MSVLAKLNLTTVHRNAKKDPVIARREKLVAAIEEQGRVFSALRAGTEYTVPVQRWKEGDEGQRVKVTAQKRVRAWFFEQDGGFYVQCRYGTRILNINGKSNAVFVDNLEGVQTVLDAFKSAVEAGELDKAIAYATKARAG